ncbi:MAG: sigma-54-dependent Fis family transcriptional regulator [Labilithrix sp.]|nr:sigma-54-dependent Fis family transcriptional regulator [Labilithrix sp.]MCW5816052.1 sigma-54-dependent Fis family transcriptional regulator [Labilithrix sp.]
MGSGAPAAKPRVLYVDGAEDVREVFAAVFADDFECLLSADTRTAFEVLTARQDVDVVVSDAPPDAFDAFPDVQRILLVEHDAPADAKGRLFAYLTKPWDRAQLALAIERATKIRRLEQENRRLMGELRSSVGRIRIEEPAREPARLLASSAPMKKVVEQIGAVAGTDASVLLHGETGTGKELIAAEVHERSPRRRARFVAQNLAALPPELMTSELFGHVKGAFTGAQSARRGLFELADGGTLFLDEIGEAPLSLQALLLRALESSEFWPVGASEPKRVDVRIVAATNRDLLADAHQGLFRLDLYYRLAVCPIEVPPLRARPEDVRVIGQHLLEASSKRMNRDLPRLGEAAWRTLEAHPWPGNVRELGNVMERLVIYHAGRDVEPADLGLPQTLRPSLFPFAPRHTPISGFPAAEPSAPRSRPYLPVSDPVSSTIEAAPPSGPFYERHDSEPPMSRPRMEVDAIAPGPLSLEVPEGGTTFDDLEREILLQVLSRADHNKSRAARSLGMSESTFRSRMKRLGLKG